MNASIYQMEQEIIKEYFVDNYHYVHLSKYSNKKESYLQIVATGFYIDKKEIDLICKDKKDMITYLLNSDIQNYSTITSLHEDIENSNYKEEDILNDMLKIFEKVKSSEFAYYKMQKYKYSNRFNLVRQVQYKIDLFKYLKENLHK